MMAFGKTLAAGTLAFGAMGSSMSGMGSWHFPQHMQQKQHDNEYKQASYDGSDWKNGQKFYELKWDDRQKLCNDDHYWMSWSRQVGYDDKMRDKLCADQWNNRDDKQYGIKDWNSNDWNDDSRSATYHKNEQSKQSYSAQSQEHEKQAYSLLASSDRQSDNSRYGNDDRWSKDHGSSSDSTNVAAYAVEQNDAQASVKADTTQATVVNNYNYVNGDNNVINNSISVANTASTEQQASSSQSSQAAISYDTSSQDERGKGMQGWNGYGYGDSSSKDQQSFQLAAMSEKSSSSDVKQSSSYKLYESYMQSDESDGSGDYGNKYDKMWNGGDQKQSHHDENCDYAQSKRDECDN